jgi:hypothetical protein
MPFPAPVDLWAKYRAWKGLMPEAEQIVLQDYYADGSNKTPRYDQVNAVNAAIEALHKGDRLRLDSKRVGVDDAARQMQYIEILRLGLIKGHINR